MKTAVARLTLVCISLILIGIFTGQGNTKINPEIIVGIWLMDSGKGDVVKDSSSNGHDGKLVAGNAKWEEGKLGLAMELSGGKDQYVLIPHEDSLTLTRWTLTAWIKLSGGRTQSIEQKELMGGPPVNYGMWVSDSGILTQGFTSQGGEWNSISGNTTAADNQWHHVVATYDQKFMRLYVDGSLENELPVTVVPASNSEPVVIGGDARNTYNIDGLIDDVGLFNKALAENDIKSIMTEGLGRATGVAAVSFAGKLATSWGKLKSGY